MTFTLRPFQVESRDWLLGRKRAILADEMGLGKTLTAVDVCRAEGAEKIVVLAPPRTEGGWARHFAEQYPADFQAALSPKELVARLAPSILDPMVAFVPWSRLSEWATTADYNRLRRNRSSRLQEQETKYEAKGEEDPGFDVDAALNSYKARYNARVRKARQSAKWMEELTLKGATLIIDEAHFAKEEGRGRSRNAWLLAQDAERVLMLTATPLLSRPIDIQQALRKGCKAGDWATRERFGDRYCKRKNHFTYNGYDYLGAENTEELSKKLAPYAIRHEVKDVAPDMPSVVAIEEDLGFKLPKALKELEEDKGAWAAIAKCDSDEVKLPYGIVFGEYRRLVALAKAPAIAEWCQAQQEPILLFGYHRDALQTIAKKLKVPALMGGVSDKVAHAAIRDFQEGELPVLVAGIGVLGTGFDGLQKACRVVAFAEPAWVPGEMEQAIGRLRRIGAKADCVRVYYLTAAGSSDAYIYNTLSEKSEVITEVLGSSIRGRR